MKSVINKINNFVQSEYFIALMGVLTFLGWYFKIWFAMLFVMLIFSVIPLVFFKETKHLLCFLTMFSFLISDNRHYLTKYKYLLIPLILILVCGFIVSLCRFKRDWSVLLPRKIKGFHVALILLIIPFAFGGLGSLTENALAILIPFLLVLLIAFGYTFFVVTNTGAERKNIMDYLLKILFVVGIVVSLEMIIHLANYKSFETLKSMLLTKEWSLGWGAANNVAPVFLLTIPATLYFCVRKNKLTPLFVIIAMCEMGLIVMTGCRGALLFSVLAIPYMFCYIVRQTENKFSFCITLCAVCTVMTFVIGYFSKEIMQLISGIGALGLSDNQRNPLYQEAIGYFKKWPIFGAGWDHLLGHRPSGVTSDYTPRWYHSTALQILADMGICGVIFFVIFYYWRYKSFLAVFRKPQGMALLSSLLLFDLYGMIDTNFFGPTFFIILALISFAVQCGAEDYEMLAFKAKPFDWLRSFVRKCEKPREPAND